MFSNFFRDYSKILIILFIWKDIPYTNKKLRQTMSLVTQLIGFSWKSRYFFFRTGNLEVSHSQKCFHLLVKVRNTLSVPLPKVTSGEDRIPPLSRAWLQGSDAQNSGFLLMMKVNSNQKAACSDRSAVEQRGKIRTQIP